MTTRSKYIGAGVLVVLIAAAAYTYWRWNPRPGTETFEQSYDLVLRDYEGEEVRLSAYKREVLLVHAWASWCTYCADELRNLAQLKSEYGDRIVILAPNRAEALPVAKPFSDALGLAGSIEFLLDPTDSFYKSIGGYAMPETLFINDRGEVFYHQRGPMDLGEVRAKISELLN